MKIIRYFIGGLIIVILVGLAVGEYKIFTTKEFPIGSIIQSQEYNATTTSAINPFTPTQFTLKKGYGSLGSVVITGAGTGRFVLYDATTTNVTLRAKATTSLSVLADFPTAAAAGTYTFDRLFYEGLLVDMTATTLIPTTTITWR